jgi:hypothetical protein
MNSAVTSELSRDVQVPDLKLPVLTRNNMEYSCHGQVYGGGGGGIRPLSVRSHLKVIVVVVSDPLFRQMLFQITA